MTKPLYFWNGTTFELVGPTTPQSPIAYQTSAPTGPATGDLWIDSDADVDTYNRQLTRYYFIATAGQTSISGADANNLTLAYTPGSEMVHLNGALLVRGVDYTATNGTSITGLSALALNDVVEVFAYTAFTVANAYTKSEVDGIAAAAPGLRMIVPTSVAVGSGSGSVDAIGNVTFSGGCSTVSLNGCFSSTYDNYRIVMHIESANSNQDLRLRLRASGTDASGANYENIALYSQVNSAVVGNVGGTGQTSGYGWGFTPTGWKGAGYIDMCAPFLTQYTVWNHTGGGGVYQVWGNSLHKVTTSYDGFTIYSGSGNLTAGTIRVYGYKD